MNSLFLLAFWMSFAAPGAHTSPPVSNQNVVRVCSVAAGCQEFAARLLEPATAPASGGQRVFIDPVTKTAVPPTNAQLEELAVTISESMVPGELSVETRPDGTLRLKSTQGFSVDQTATIHRQEGKP
jgi:hypothetical protein